MIHGGIMYKVTMTLTEEQRDTLKKSFDKDPEGTFANVTPKFKKINLYPHKKHMKLDTFDRLVLFHVRNKQGKQTGRTIAVIHEGDNRHVGVFESPKFCKRINREAAIGRAFYVYATSLKAANPRKSKKSNMFSFEASNPTQWNEIKSLPEWVWAPKKEETQPQPQPTEAIA